MATGYKLPDGRDLSDIFGTGSYGSAVSYQTSDGKDVGYQFAGGSTGIVTGYKDPSGVDLGSRFGGGVHCVITTDYRESYYITGTSYTERHYYIRYGYDSTGKRWGAITQVPVFNGGALVCFTCRRERETGRFSGWEMYLSPDPGIAVIYVNGCPFTHQVYSSAKLAYYYTATGSETYPVIWNAAAWSLTFSPIPTGYA